jgi:hypothetical protein
MTKPSRGHLIVETPGDKELGAPFLEGAQQCMVEGLRNPGHGTATLTPLPGRCITGSAGFEIGSSS